MKVETHFNLLISYFYANDAIMNSLAELVKNGEANVMIDSGAFSSHTLGKEINLDEYCKFLEKYSWMAEKYVTLDCVGDENKTKKNYETMLARGFNPMYVVTTTENDFDYLRAAVENNRDICVAGGTAIRSKWMDKRFQDVYRETSGKARIHGLGYVNRKSMFNLPITSVDSSSFNACQRYGGLFYFQGSEIKKINKYSINKSLVFRNELYQVGVKDLKSSDFRGGYSIQNLISYKAWIKYQKFAKKNNLDLFLAFNNKIDIDRLVYINRNINNLCYEELAALKKLGVDFEVITLPPIPPTDEIFIPSRNLMLATIAVIYYNADNVFLACLADGDPTMLDSKKEGFEEMSNILSKFSNREIKVSSPYIELTKNQLVGKFNNKEKLKDTFSCFFPVDGKPCGDCKGCLTRNIALETNGIKSNVELSERMKKEFDKIIENYK